MDELAGDYFKCKKEAAMRKTSKPLLFILPLLFLLFAALEPAYAQYAPRGGRIIKNKGNKILLVSQSVDFRNPSNLINNTNSRIGVPSVNTVIPKDSPTTPIQEYGVDLNAIALTPTQASAIQKASIDGLYQTNTSGVKSQDELVQRARTMLITDSLPTLVASLRTAMDTHQVSAAWFTFEQTVDISIAPIGPGAPTFKTKKISWSLSLDKVNTPIYPDIQVVDTDPWLVRAIYTPLKLSQGLPSSWNRTSSDLGYLTYEVIEIKTGNLISTALTSVDAMKVNMNGVYDDPDPSATGVNPNSGLACLTNHDRKKDDGTDFCAADARATKDLRGIMDDVGAVLARLEYRRTLEPIYNLQPDGTYKSEYRMQIDKRTVSDGSSCSTLMYRNEGKIGFVLNDKTDLYEVQPDGDYKFLGSKSSQIIPIVDKYIDVTREVDKAAFKSGDLSGYVIDPANPGGSLLVANTLISQGKLLTPPALGDITEINTNTAANFNTSSANVVVQVTPNNWGDGASRVRFGSASDNNLDGGSGRQFDFYMTFDVSNPNLLSTFSIYNVGFDDYIGISINGNFVHAGPDFGSKLELVTSTEKYCYDVCGPAFTDPETGIDYPEYGYYYYNYVYVDEGSAGQRQPERGTSWVSGVNYPALNLDLKPYLIPNATNRIDMRIIAAGGGEGELNIRVKGCQ